MSMKKETDLKLKNSDGTEAKDLEVALNSIKDKNVKNGIMPNDKKTIVVQDFSGKVLKRSKSVYKTGKQYTLKKGTKWEDVDPFMRKHISFSAIDFE